MTRVLIAGDWHLGTYSTLLQARLALEFLQHARSDGDRVVLNGDIFEGLFEPVARAEHEHPELSALIREMARAGELRRTEGNHDPGAGAPRVVLQHEMLGRVLVAHGHQVDPVHDSSVGSFGDGISRRFGRWRIVRGAAMAAEAVVAGTMAGSVDRHFRRRCLTLVEREGCELGVFGHNHRRHLAAGDPYANHGRLRRDCLEYLVIDDAGPALAEFRVEGSSGAVRAVS